MLRKTVVCFLLFHLDCGHQLEFTMVSFDTLLIVIQLSSKSGYYQCFALHSQPLSPRHKVVCQKPVFKPEGFDLWSPAGVSHGICTWILQRGESAVSMYHSNAGDTQIYVKALLTAGRC